MSYNIQLIEGLFKSIKRKPYRVFFNMCKSFMIQKKYLEKLDKTDKKYTFIQKEYEKSRGNFSFISGLLPEVKIDVNYLYLFYLIYLKNEVNISKSVLKEIVDNHKITNTSDVVLKHLKEIEAEGKEQLKELEVEIQKGGSYEEECEILVGDNKKFYKETIEILNNATKFYILEYNKNILENLTKEKDTIKYYDELYNVVDKSDWLNVSSNYKQNIKIINELKANKNVVENIEILKRDGIKNNIIHLFNDILQKTYSNLSNYLSKLSDELNEYVDVRSEYFKKKFPKKLTEFNRDEILKKIYSYYFVRLLLNEVTDELFIKKTEIVREKIQSIEKDKSKEALLNVVEILGNFTLYTINVVIREPVIIDEGREVVFNKEVLFGQIEKQIKVVSGYFDKGVKQVGYGYTLNIINYLDKRVNNIFFEKQKGNGLMIPDITILSDSLQKELNDFDKVIYCILRIADTIHDFYVPGTRGTVKDYNKIHNIKFKLDGDKSYSLKELYLLPLFTKFSGNIGTVPYNVLSILNIDDPDLNEFEPTFVKKMNVFIYRMIKGITGMDLSVYLMKRWKPSKRLLQELQVTQYLPDDIRLQQLYLYDVEELASLNIIGNENHGLSQYIIFVYPKGSLHFNLPNSVFGSISQIAPIKGFIGDNNEVLYDMMSNSRKFFGALQETNLHPTSKLFKRRDSKYIPSETWDPLNSKTVTYDKVFAPGDNSIVYTTNRFLLRDFIGICSDNYQLKLDDINGIPQITKYTSSTPIATTPVSSSLSVTQTIKMIDGITDETNICHLFYDKNSGDWGQVNTANDNRMWLITDDTLCSYYSILTHTSTINTTIINDTCYTILYKGKMIYSLKENIEKLQQLFNNPIFIAHVNQLDLEISDGTNVISKITYNKGIPPQITFTPGLPINLLMEKFIFRINSFNLFDIIVPTSINNNDENESLYSFIYKKFTASKNAFLSTLYSLWQSKLFIDKQPAIKLLLGEILKKNIEEYYSLILTIEPRFDYKIGIDYSKINSLIYDILKKEYSELIVRNPLYYWLASDNPFTPMNKIYNLISTNSNEETQQQVNNILLYLGQTPILPSQSIVLSPIISTPSIQLELQNNIKKYYGSRTRAGNFNYNNLFKHFKDDDTDKSFKILFSFLFTDGLWVTYNNPIFMALLFKHVEDIDANLESLIKITEFEEYKKLKTKFNGSSNIDQIIKNTDSIIQYIYRYLTPDEQLILNAKIDEIAKYMKGEISKMPSKPTSNTKLANIFYILKFWIPLQYNHQLDVETINYNIDNLNYAINDYERIPGIEVIPGINTHSIFFDIYKKNFNLHTGLDISMFTIYNKSINYYNFIKYFADFIRGDVSSYAGFKMIFEDVISKDKRHPVHASFGGEPKVKTQPQPKNSIKTTPYTTKHTFKPRFNNIISITKENLLDKYTEYLDGDLFEKLKHQYIKVYNTSSNLYIYTLQIIDMIISTISDNINDINPYFREVLNSWVYEISKILTIYKHLQYIYSKILNNNIIISLSPYVEIINFNDVLKNVLNQINVINGQFITQIIPANPLAISLSNFFNKLGTFIQEITRITPSSLQLNSIVHIDFEEQFEAKKLELQNIAKIYSAL